jgi:hypothetical protein
MLDLHTLFALTLIPATAMLVVSMIVSAFESTDNDL